MQASLIKNKETFDPSKVTDEVLYDDHKQTHVWWATIRGGSKVKGWNQEDVFNAHELIVREMRRRGIKHSTPLLLSAANSYDQPITASERDGEAKGPMMFLPSILKAFSGDFMICEDFVTIVGGLCTAGKTRGDIDILLKCKEPRDESSPLGMATKFRIARALAKQQFKEDRIEFLYDDFSGPFTSHVHVFDLVLRRKVKRELHEMTASDNDYISTLKRNKSELKKDFSIKVEVVAALKVKGTADLFSYIVALMDDGELAPAGKTFNTNIKASEGEALEINFVDISQNIDPKTKKLHFNMFAPKVVGKADKADSVETAKKLVSESGGQVQSRPLPVRFKGKLEEDEYIDNFNSMVLAEETEEFEFSLSKDWIDENTIPDRLLKTNNSEIRNNDSFIVKKDFDNRSVICLRNKENKIKAEKLVHLVEA